MTRKTTTCMINANFMILRCVLGDVNNATCGMLHTRGPTYINCKRIFLSGVCTINVRFSHRFRVIIGSRNNAMLPTGNLRFRDCKFCHFRQNIFRTRLRPTTATLGDRTYDVRVQVSFHVIHSRLRSSIFRSLILRLPRPPRTTLVVVVNVCSLEVRFIRSIQDAVQLSATATVPYVNETDSSVDYREMITPIFASLLLAGAFVFLFVGGWGG